MAAGLRPESELTTQISRGVPYISAARPAQPGGIRGGDVAGRGIQFGQHGGDVMIDGLGGDEQLRGDLGVGVPGADQVENLTLAPGQPERVRAGRGPRPGGDRPDAEPAHLLPGELGGGRGAEAGEDLQGLAQRRLLRRVVQGQRGLVRAAQAGPQPGGLLPVACHLQPVGLGELTARRPGRTGAPQPDGDRAAVPGVAAGRRRHRPARLRVRLGLARPPASTPRRGPAAPE